MVQQQIKAAQIVGGVGGGSGGGVALLELGKTTIGASVETASPGVQYLKKITVPAGGAFLSAIGAYVKNPGGSVGELSVGVMSDIAGVPGLIIGALPHPGQNSLYVNASPRWVMFPIAQWLAAGDYWIVLFHVGAAGGVGIDLYYDTGGVDKTISPGSGNTWFADGASYTINAGTRDYSIKAQLLTTVVPSGSDLLLSDNFDRADSSTIGAPQVGPVPVEVTGDWTIVSNDIVAPASANALILWDIARTTYSVRAILSALVGDPFLVVRGQDANNFCGLLIQNGGVSILYQRVAGTFGAFGGSGVSVTWAAGDEVRVDVTPFGLAWFRNGELMEAVLGTQFAGKTKVGFKGNGVGSAGVKFSRIEALI